MDFKKAGDLIYVVGATYNELGGSEYFSTQGFVGNSVPKVNPQQAKELMNRLSMATEKGLVKAHHDCSEGGIGVCLSEMAIGGDIGTIIDLSEVNKNLRSDFELFSESNTRWILEVEKQNEQNFEKILKREKTPFIKLGETKGKKLIINEREKSLINLDINTIKIIWKNTIWDIMS